MLAQARHQVRRQERRVARYRDRQRMGSRAESGVQTRERAGETADAIAHHAVAEGRVALEVLVGIDDDLVDLRREARDHVLDHRLSAQHLQPLVDAAHAAAEAAGEDDAAHAHARKLDGGAPSSRRNMALKADGLS